MRPALAEALRVPAEPLQPWQGDLFGLDVRSEFALEGIAPRGPSRGGSRRRTYLELVDPAALDAEWPAATARRLRAVRSPTGRLLMSIDEHLEAGYRVAAGGFGRFIIAGDGRTIRCAPGRSPVWSWQRLLIGQVLPLAAVLQGLEVIHAAAVAVGEWAIAFAGASGVGKTSVAGRLAQEGLRLLSDDVVALEPFGERLLAHPGGAVLGLRRDEAARLRATGPGLPGDRVAFGVKAYRALPREPRPLPLVRLYLLERRDEPTGVRIERLESPDPRQLLPVTFTSFLRSPARLVAQLDVHARIARDVEVFRVRSGTRADAAALTSAIREHVGGADGAWRRPG